MSPGYPCVTWSMLTSRHCASSLLPNEEMQSACFVPMCSCRQAPAFLSAKTSNRLLLQKLCEEALCTPVRTDLIDLQRSLLTLLNTCQLAQFRYRILAAIESRVTTMVGLELPQAKDSHRAPFETRVDIPSS